MKKFLKFKNVLPLFFVCLMFVSCNTDDDGGGIDRPEENLVELATATDELSTLVAALQRADLVTSLQADGSLTVLAPNNAAFSAFLTANNFASLDDVPVDVLRQVLLNHVLPVEVSLNDFLGSGRGYISTTADGPVDDSKISMYFNATSGVIFNGEASVVSGSTNIRASNGTIHIVDAVIPLPTIVDFATLDDRFETLVDALTSDGQPDFVSTLSTPNGTDPAPFTVFAPVNDAFVGLGAIPTGDELTAVLQHHVIANSNILAQNITDELESPNTLEGDTLSFIVQNTTNIFVRDGSGNSSTGIILANVQATNGVIHAINRVLIPNTDN